MMPDPPPDSPPPPSRYRLGKEIARGGLGRVLEAWDPELNRDVAVKLVLDGLPGELQERFVREAQLTARLEHPNIVPVHDIVRREGQPTVLAMKRINGRDLGSLIRSLGKGDEEALAAWSRPRLLAMFQGICQGVAFAHARGVIHRDLKPSNVMLGEFGEVLVVDWGLAKELGGPITGEVVAEAPRQIGSMEATLVPGRSGESSAVTLEGAVVGTPAYMPPEQAAGRTSEIDERSDVYSLGAILYEILTFRPPVEGDSLAELLSRAQSGVGIPPSQRLREREASAADVPAELDAIVMKALATRKIDRYASATDLSRDIQLFLEGVKERERRAQEAAERVKAGRHSLARFRGLRAEIAAQELAHRELSAAIRPFRAAAEKRPLWEAEARLKRLREERVNAFSAASAAFSHALTVDPRNREASEGKCELFMDRFLEAEARRDEEEMLLNRNTLAQYDRDGAYRARLGAPGALSIRCFTRDCGCLAPVTAVGRRVEIAEACAIPWLDGRARPGLKLGEMDRPVPVVTTYPEGVHWGHTERCSRREISGVEISISRYEEHDRKLVPGPERRLGVAPLEKVELPIGSWLCVLRAPGFEAVRLPVRIDRGAAWVQDVTLYRAGEIPEGFCHVPGGPFVFGGRHAHGDAESTLVTEDLFVARDPVTADEYRAFLDDLSATGRLEEARRRQPREGDDRYLRETDGRFEIRAGESKAMLGDGRFPVMGISWLDACAYLAWRSTRDGRAYRLMHEEEYEKAVRGVDGRVYPWGDTFDATFLNSALSQEHGQRIVLPGTFAADLSPYGVRDLAGNMSTWCWNALEKDVRPWRAVRGGAWISGPVNAQSGYRRGTPPQHYDRNKGMRLAFAPLAPSYPGG